ncbi:MAG: hypothetical protein OEQ28_15915, partial [Acidobacteriota bacterium]|nr:hypothetical protein [Acidobacteriota bacterium]
MKIQRFAVSGALVSLLMFFAATVLAQVPDSGFAVKRTKSISKTAKFGPGGTIVVLGAPKGSVSVEGWTSHEVSVEAEIVVLAENEEDAAQLANVSGFS